MTAFDRYEQRLPELMDELAAPNTPDYFDDMLRAAARTPQRPAWSAPERWLPMGVIARPLPAHSFPWRPILVAAWIVLLALASIAYIGAQRRVAPPFGPAANGLLAIGTADGDIVTVDPATGRTTPLVTGPATDSHPVFSNDGRRIVFHRQMGNTSALFVANADGSDVHRLLRAETADSTFEWSSDSDRALLVDGTGGLSIVDVESGTSRPIALHLDVASATWRPNHDQIVVAATARRNSEDWVAANRTYWVVDADGSGAPRKIAASRYAIDEPVLTPDGSSLVYATWEPVPGPPRIVNIDSGQDRPLISDPDPNYLWQTPVVSPDGTKVILHQSINNTSLSQLVLVNVAAGTVTAVCPPFDNPKPDVIFSPDGAEIVAAYPILGKTWLYDGDYTNSHEVPFNADTGASWQRRAR